MLIVLFAALAVPAWHWRQDLRVVAGRFLSSPPPLGSSSTNGSQGGNSESSAAASSSQAAPATGTTVGGQVQPPAQAPAGQSNNPAGSQAPTAQTPLAAPPAATGSTQSPQASQPPSDQSQGGQSSAEQSPGNQSSTGQAPGVQSQTEQSQPSNASQAGNPASGTAAKPDDSGETAVANQAAPERKTVKAQSTVEDLEAEGEKYLYGNGVPENCTRARTSLLAAAQRSSALAQNVLGTMYATGHCATRDLPTAYRWFSRSLRKDPSNTRIEEDLKVLWNQMTPQERDLALRDLR